MYQDWLSSFQFRWTPILTYTRRHLALLDWFEANVEPVAFIDRPDKEALGVAIIAPDLRLTIRRSGMVLESGMSGLSLDRLMPAVRGVFEVLEPSSVLATEFLSTGVVPCEDADYYRLCARFGNMVTNRGLEPSDTWHVTDGSAVVDLTSATMKLQLEWGIVRDEELLQRLRTPEASRLVRTMPLGERASIAKKTKPGRDVPAVGIYVDQVGYWRVGGGVSEVLDVMERVTEAQHTASNVASMLASKFHSESREGAS